MLCISEKSKFRKCLVWLVTWKWFDNIILFFILFNTVVLLNYDYKATHYNEYSEANNFVEKSTYFFTVVFSIEFLLKVLALGFITHRNAYL